MNDRGFTLVEIVFCVATIGLLVLSIASLEHSASIGTHVMAGTPARQDTLAGLLQLSQDIHRAEALESIARTRMVLTIEGRRVEWVSGKNSVDRIQQGHRQTWRAQGGLQFQEQPPRTVEIFFPGSMLYAYCALGGAR